MRSGRSDPTILDTERPEEPLEEDSIKILVLTQGSRKLAIPLSYVKDLCKVRGVTRVPGVPPFVEGLVSAGGEIYALLSLSYFWDWKPFSRHYEDREFFMVILEKDGVSFGIDSERNVQVREIPLLSIERGDYKKDREAVPYIMGIIPDRNGAIYLIDLAELMVNSEIYSFISDEE